MLAYSSIAQAGYILIAFPALTQDAVAGAIVGTMVRHFHERWSIHCSCFGVGAAGFRI